MKTTTYTYRNLPCTGLTWYVFGKDTVNRMSGVLEWCYDRDDALNRLEQMKRFPQFKGFMSISQWCDE